LDLGPQDPNSPTSAILPQPSRFAPFFILLAQGVRLSRQHHVIHLPGETSRKLADLQTFCILCCHCPPESFTMGSAISRCSSRNSASPPSGFAERGQKVLDRQPNWLVPPSRWRSHPCPHHPVRYRTPTPYPKDDRKRLEGDQHARTRLSEKAVIIETAVVNRLEVTEPPFKGKPNHPALSRIRHPQTALKITWERSPRLNRFERAT
jgi:hypothetical protein